MSSDSMLAVFVDRHTMRHERVYDHPIERVWEAVSQGEHLDVWMLPVSRVDARVGGRCSFSWGSPEERAIVGEVTECDPPRVIQYTFGDRRSFLRFELTPKGEGTRLVFTQSFRPGEHSEPNPDGSDDWGADQPGGPDTPWRPGFVQGFHRMLDHLPQYLEGTWTAADLAAGLAAAPTDEDLAWVETYRRHIRDTIPAS